MSEKNIVICDEDLRYANALAENILERDELNVKVFTFRNVEKALTFLKNRTVHILIVDEKYWSERQDAFTAEQVFILMRGGTLEAAEQAIYKYQCADNIIRQIFETYVEKTQENILRTMRRNHTRLEAVYSPIRGIGKTSFAIALGKEKAKREKVLYLNLEEYAGFEESFSGEDTLNLGDLLYYMKQSEGHLGLRLQTAVRQMGELYYVPPIYLAVDLKEVSKEAWMEFLTKLRNLNLYDLILLDLGESVQGLFQILQMCDKIHMPIRENAISDQKILRYEECVERLQLDKIKNITQRFVLPENLEEYVKLRMKEDE